MVNATSPIRRDDSRLETSIEEGENARDIVLDGVTELRMEMVRTTYKVVRKIKTNNQAISLISKTKLSEVSKKLNLPLREVTAEELLEYRRNKVPSFVLKMGNRLYYTEIPSNANFMTAGLFCRHKCADARNECRRLSAAEDEKGGCAKVRNFSKFIERYPWIVEGFETFGTELDAFVVGKCSHYEKCPPQGDLLEVNKPMFTTIQSNIAYF